MRHHGFSQGAGRCWPIHSFLSKQPRAAILSHQSRCAPEDTEHWDVWKDGDGAQQSFRSLLSPGVRQMYVPHRAGREQQGPAQAFGSRPSQQLLFHHLEDFLYLCKPSVNLLAHYLIHLKCIFLYIFSGWWFLSHRSEALEEDSDSGQNIHLILVDA